MMIKKLFDWTPRDIAYWEKLRQKGLRHFIGWYGVVITGGGLFILIGLATIVIWLKQVIGAPVISAQLIFLAGEIIFVLLVCLVAGVVNSLITWVVEERLYRKYKARDLPGF